MAEKLGLRGFFLGVLPAEALHATSSVHELLLAREERVALVAEFGVQLGLGRAGDELVAARTGDLSLYVRGVRVSFHVSFQLSSKGAGRGPSGGCLG